MIYVVISEEAKLAAGLLWIASSWKTGISKISKQNKISPESGPVLSP